MVCKAQSFKPGERIGTHPERKTGSGRRFLDALLQHFGAFHLTTGRQTLVAEHAHDLHFGPLATAFAELQYLHIARAGHAVFIGHLGFFRHRAPQHQQLADVLNRRGAEFFGNCLKHGLARGAVIVEYAHLDQPVGIECGIDLFFDGRTQSVASNEHDRVEVMGIGAVNFALGGSECDLGHGTIIVYTAVNGPLMGMKVKTQSKKVNKAWLNQHVNDPYVRLAKIDGYRARAAYKLKEIDETLGLIKPGDIVVDLGSTPGAWSQYLRRRLSPSGAAVGQLNGQILALDMLPMDAVEGVHFILGDFREEAVLRQLEDALSERGVRAVDVVVSDMSPNLSGIGSADAARITDLIELAVDFSIKNLKPDGSLVVKLFHGGAYDPTVALFRQTFKVVKSIKPKASRDKSSETFLIGLGLKASR
jgi:23S rRNA (uridine2552-2'-O)-methyltransferase